MSKRISVADLLTLLGPHPDRYDFTLNGGEIAALVDLAVAACEYRDADPLGTAQGLRLEQALARFDFSTVTKIRTPR